MKTELEALTEALPDGFELRFGRGRSLKLLSYAIRFNGVYLVDHATTCANRLAGYDIAKHLEIERTRYPHFPILTT